MPGIHKNPTISFRPTAQERVEIETRIALSGMQKRQYITRACIYANIVVVGKKENVQRIVDEVEKLRQSMQDIVGQLLEGAVPLSVEGWKEMQMECIALANTVVDILNGAAYLFRKNAEEKD